MKKINYLVLLCCLFASCKEENLDCISNPPSCIEEKITAFSNLEYAEKVIHVYYKDQPYYWFVDSYADGGETIYDRHCMRFCITDLEGFTDIPCEPDFFEAPMIEVWKKK